jgi:hypothetical protein
MTYEREVPFINNIGYMTELSYTRRPSYITCKMKNKVSRTAGGATGEKKKMGKNETKKNTCSTVKLSYIQDRSYYP